MQKQTARKKSSQALLLVDVVNHFEFPDGDKILKNALPLASRLAKLKARARRAGIPSIYVNDNFGEWHSDAARLLFIVCSPDALEKNLWSKSSLIKTTIAS